MNGVHKAAGIDRALEIWSRRKWLGILVFSGVFSMAASIVAFLPDVYRASAKLLVESQQVPEEFVRSTVTTAVERRVQTISQAILSRERLDSLINSFGLYADMKKHGSQEEIIQQVRRDVSVDLKAVDEHGGANTTIAFTISFTGSDPQTVAAVTNTLASYYIEEDLKNRERQAGGTAEFLQSQLNEMKKKLDEQEKLVSKFKEEHIGELPEQRDANLATLERLNTEVMLNSEKQIRAREQRAIVGRQLASSPGDAASRPEAAIEKLAKLNQELADLRRRYSDKYPDVIRVQQEIAQLQRRLSEPGGKGFDAVSAADPYTLQLQQAVKSADAELRVLAAEEANLHKAIAVYQGRVENAPRREQQFQELSRDYLTTQEVYGSLLKRYEESKIAESMEHRQKGEQFRILDPAIPPDSPAAPDRWRLILFGLALSLAIAGGAVMAAEQLDTSFHTVEEIRAFSRVPVLVTIPRIVTALDARRGLRRSWLAAAASILGIALIVGASYWVARGNQSLVALVSGSQKK
jgi:succinoglycan biosynthesis transport protein ExoP